MAGLDDEAGEAMRVRDGIVRRSVKRIRARSARVGLRGLLASAALVAVLAACVWQGNEWREARNERARSAVAITTAERQVLDLTTLTPKTVNGKLREMQARVTGSFADQLERFSSIFASAVETSKVTAKGKIDVSGIEKYDGRSADVLVASSASIQTAEQKQPTVRTYRMRVSLERKSGAWLISGMEFVP